MKTYRICTINDNQKICTAIALVMLTLLTAGCQSGLPITKEISGKVTKVHDGDSIHITPSGEKRIIVRLAAIDAPEIKQTHGVVSRDYLRGLIMNQTVKAYCNKLDKYRRQICVVTHDAKDINLQMLQAGQAWYYRRYQDEQSRSDRRKYKKAEAGARKKMRGLWQRSQSVAPWEYRAAAKQN